MGTLLECKMSHNSFQEGMAMMGTTVVTAVRLVEQIGVDVAQLREEKQPLNKMIQEMLLRVNESRGL